MIYIVVLVAVIIVPAQLGGYGAVFAAANDAFTAKGGATGLLGMVPPKPPTGLARVQFRERRDGMFESFFDGTPASSGPLEDVVAHARARLGPRCPRAANVQYWHQSGAQSSFVQLKEHTDV